MRTFLLLLFGFICAASFAQNTDILDKGNNISNDTVNKNRGTTLNRNGEINPAMQKYFKSSDDYSYSKPLGYARYTHNNGDAICGYSIPTFHSISSNSITVQTRNNNGYSVKAPTQATVISTDTVSTIQVKTTLKKRALVIGNNNYSHSAKLDNPINDANAMEKALKQLGFEVIKRTDVTIATFQEVLKEYADSVMNADVSLFYFAGHGIQVENINYLLPIDAEIDRKEHVPFETISVERILRLTDNVSAKRLNIVILDACRNNPFKTWERGGSVGLMPLNPASGSLIAYATSPNSVASDGTGDNGLYTGELIKQLLISQRIEDVFINTRINVEEKSWNMQSPWELARLRGSYNLHD